MTHSFLLLGCKVDLSIPQWSVLWSDNQIIGCNYLFLWLLDLLLLASFTDVSFSLEQPWGCSLVVPMDDDTLKEANTEVLIWIWIQIHTLQGPFLLLPFLQQNWQSAMPVKTCTLKEVICTVCFCTGLLNPFTAMLAALSLINQPIKVPNLKPLKRFCSLLTSTWKEFYQNGQYWKHICYRTIRYTAWRHVCELFSVQKFHRLWQWRG